MARGFRRFDSAFTCQASAAISSNGFSAGAKTEVNTLSTQNADGAFGGEVEIDVTAWTTDTRCDVYQEGLAHSGSGNAVRRKLGSKSITGTGKYTLQIDDISEQGFIVLGATGPGFTASASFKAIYPSDT
ncbi:MAG: hypothetical protein KUG67_00490 [Proteobacteria bacterium]|nr:hypothetical protein [Pseudomonadota bacterium]